MHHILLREYVCTPNFFLYLNNTETVPTFKCNIFVKKTINSLEKICNAKQLNVKNISHQQVSCLEQLG